MAKKNPPHKDTDALRYSTDHKRMIALAREHEKTTDEIVVILTRGSAYAEVRIFAEQWAKELGISQAEFVRMAGRRS